ncbi:erythroid differentiation-related factor 1 [Onthophagus taurus]|uniref:erythroid differentiation-related factor 1 n=1 Tax=Onthophagus taurus TaxID=166361 RepID=UPI000C1FE10C|nr:erythroid differentiation-related factor 1 [Onthophagus taurus]
MSKNQSENDETVRKEVENIKSTAVVKYSVPKPASFNKLQCNTDLNLPPSNWLSSSADSYGLQHVLYQPKGFTSFRMAHMFPDCVGEVDVVSDSENIKKLLKIPYQKGQISMVVHRIENTLLLDDFDIYKHILRTAETEWGWLKKFFCENVEREVVNEDRTLYMKNKKHKALKQKSLVSKFLYHSLVPSENDETLGDDRFFKCDTLQGPLLPEPSPSEEVPDPGSFDQPFNRNVVWSFEDIDMLLGTDMPIFGGGTHPCISLRLNDMSKPINVLTGIDYWLDNLMSNVPEVVMCYHLNGIVQKYELIKTEDLPQMDNSKFSPKLIRDVAQSILSFLKSNATKAGHTYWLFKGKDEEVIKLYDLTSLCSSPTIDNDQNPFTVPVAMLLYKVARNMKSNLDRRQPGTVRMLLKNCIKLLDEEKYPEIVTSSHFMLADLYIPSTTNPDNPELEQTDSEDTESIYDDDIHENDNECPTKILILNKETLDEKFNNYYKPPPPIGGLLDDRCTQGILHIASGLNCIKYFHKRDFPKEEENVPFAKPNEAIPMPYAKLSSKDKKVKNKKSKKKKGQNLPLLPKCCDNNIKTENISWNDHLKSLLYEKAVLIYAILTERHYLMKRYGACLRTIGLLVRCLNILTELKHPNLMNILQDNCILARAGDSCIMIVQYWSNSNEYNEELHSVPDEDAKMLLQIEEDERIFNINLINSPLKAIFIYEIRTIEQMLLNAINCYEGAKSICDSTNMLRRLGNALNEVGSFYLNKAKQAEKLDDILEIAKKAESHLKKGIELFENAKDAANSALLYTNMGHLHRLLAHHVSYPEKRGQLTAKEKFHYEKSFENYKKALQVLGDRKNSPQVWDAVRWELSTALFSMGTILHEYPTSQLSRPEAEREVIETLQKALLYCDLDKDNSKYPLYLYRAANIHYRIASLYHSQLWSTQSCDTSRKNAIQLAKINYEKCSKFYKASGDADQFLTAQMQLVSLMEFLAETTTAAYPKLKYLKSGLEVILDVQEVIQMLVERKIDIPESDVAEFMTKRKDTSYKSYSSLLMLVKQRLQFILKSLIKVCLSKPCAYKGCDQLVNVYKKCYSLTFDLEKCEEFYGFLENLNEILVKVQSILMKNSDT